MVSVRNVFLFVVWLALFAYLGYLVYLSAHEAAHARIFSRYGISYTVLITPFYGEVIPSADPFFALSPEDARELYFLQSLVDVVASVALPVTVGIFLLAGLVAWDVTSRL